MKIIKYSIVGSTAFSAEYLSFIAIIHQLSGVNLIVPQTISFCLGLATSFLGSRLFTFKNKKKSYRYNKKIQLTTYAGLAVTNLVLTNVFLYVITQHLGIVYWIAKIIVMLSVVVWNYSVLNKHIFKTQ